MSSDSSRYIKYVLNWTPDMQERVSVLATAREMPAAVWVREAIREKLERDEQRASLRPQTDGDLRNPAPYPAHTPQRRRP